MKLMHLCMYLLNGLFERKEVSTVVGSLRRKRERERDVLQRSQIKLPNYYILVI